MSPTLSKNSTDNLFAQVYDRIYAAKDYPNEVRRIMSLASRFGWDGHSRALEIGCGTGNHTLAMVREGASITALDLDYAMVSRAIAKAKAENIKEARFVYSALADLEEKHFGFAFALFNVVSYILNENDLLSLFQNISARLNVGAPFLFDCWNGRAAIKFPPQDKQTEIEDDQGYILCYLDVANDPKKFQTDMDYKIRVFDRSGREQAEGKHHISQKWWFPETITEIAEAAGFERVFLGPLDTQKRPADDQDWKILFAFKKNVDESH